MKVDLNTGRFLKQLKVNIKGARSIEQIPSVPHKETVDRLTLLKSSQPRLFHLVLHGDRSANSGSAPNINRGSTRQVVYIKA